LFINKLSNKKVWSISWRTFANRRSCNNI